MILLLLLLFRLQAPTTAQDDDSPSSNRLWCHLPPPEKPNPELTIVEEPTPKYYSAKPKDYKPYRMLFVYDQDMSEANRLLLEEAGKAANDRFSPMVKAPVLSDIRLPRQWNKTSQACQRPQCTNRPGEYIPDKYAFPCRDPSTQKIVPGDNTTEQPSSDVAKLNKEGYSLVVYVFVNGDGADIAICKSKTKAHLAVAIICRADTDSNRPTHGVYIWCQKPNTVSKAERNLMMLHESLHIITAESLIGVGSALCPVKNLTEGLRDGEDLFPNQCKDKAWKPIDMPWKDANGKVITFRAHLAITPFVKQAAHNHFKCTTIDGAELETFSTRPNETVWAIGSPNTGHWSYRLFSDEILSPFINPSMRLSNFTLGALKDSGWYEVDLSKAEPLVISAPKENECVMATKNCQDIIGDVRALPKSLDFIAPYCDDKIVSPRCSNDGSTILFCNKHGGQSQYCPLIVSLSAVLAMPFLGYDDVVCEEAKIQPLNATNLGGTVGSGSICITFTDISMSPPDYVEQKMFPMCVDHQCDFNAKVVKVLLRPSWMMHACMLECKEKHANQVVQLPPVPFEECKKIFNDSISLICPDFNQVCPKPTPGADAIPENVTWCQQEFPHEQENENVTYGESGKFVYLDPKTFVPFKVLFVYGHDGYVGQNKTNKTIKHWQSNPDLEDAFDYVNQRLSSLVKAQPLKEVRRTRKYNDTAKTCDLPVCFGQSIPAESCFPCIKDGKVIKETGLRHLPTERIKFINNANYTLVVFVVVHGEKEKVPMCEKPNVEDVIASFCQIDLLTGRPTHGTIIICKLPAFKEEELGQVVLHGTLLILTGKSLIGGLPSFQCSDPFRPFAEKCKGTTWSIVTQHWIDKKGRAAPRTAFVSVTPNVKKAAQDHFGCTQIEGAELSMMKLADGSWCVDPSHWNHRLFSDEILSAGYSPNNRLSALTLAVLMDSGWYDVDLTRAERLVISRPRMYGCGVAAKSCHEILRNIRASGRKYDLELAAPYCDYEKIISSRCSSDHRSWLSCTKGKSPLTDYCPILVALPSDILGQHMYDSSVCEKTMHVAANEARIGAMGGNSSICVTFISIVNYTNAFYRNQVPLCVKKQQCEYNSKTFVITLFPEEDNCSGNSSIVSNGTCRVACNFKCHAKDANKIVEFPITKKTSPLGFDNCVEVLGDKISLICPDFDQVCTFLQPMKTTTSRKLPPGQTTSTRGKLVPTTKAPGPVTTKTVPPPRGTTTKVDDPLVAPTGKPGTSGIKHDSKVIALTLFMGVVFAKVRYEIF